MDPIRDSKFYELFFYKDKLRYPQHSETTAVLSGVLSFRTVTSSGEGRTTLLDFLERYLLKKMQRVWGAWRSQRPEAHAESWKLWS